MIFDDIDDASSWDPLLSVFSLIPGGQESQIKVSTGPGLPSKPLGEGHTLPLSASSGHRHSQAVASPFRSLPLSPHSQLPRMSLFLHMAVFL